MNTEQLRKLMEQDKIIVGHNESKRALEKGQSTHVVIASNADETEANRMRAYAKLIGAQVSDLNVRNDEIGTMVRKPFRISFLAVKS